MKRFEQSKADPLLDIAIVVTTGAVLWTDLLTALGTTSWIFYLAPLTISMFTWRPRTPLLVAATTTILMIVGYYLSPRGDGVAPHLAAVNRTLGLVTMWGVALVARQSITGKIELREQDWIRSGHRDLSARVQGDHEIGPLADAILRFLCRYLEVPVGLLYAKGADEGTFRRAATYALPAGSSAPETVAPGEGLVGQAAQESRILRFDELPDGYFSVASGLGESSPRHVVLVPASVDGAVIAVLELGFLHAVGRSDMDLLTAIAEPIAIALRSAQVRARLAGLLEETRRQAEELQAQQEELRVANQELEQHNSALSAAQVRLEAQQAELEQTNAHLEEQARAIEQQRDELGRVQVHLVEKADELARANQYKSEFLANMSHELRTPLNSALILSKLLADNKDGNLTAEQVKYASTIHAAGNDLLTLINDILDLARIEAGRVDTHPEKIDLAQVLAVLERTFQPVAAQRGLALSLKLAPGAPASMSTDALRLQQILRNLLSNALKFTDHGSVSLLVCSEGTDRVAFAVRDTGIGIAREHQGIIFEAFRQADGSTQRQHGGTGLGLTISRELARRLGGEITVASAPEQGSTFTLVLPVAMGLQTSSTPKPPLAASTHSPGGDEGTAPKPLVVDGGTAPKPLVVDGGHMPNTSARDRDSAPMLPIHDGRATPTLPAVEDDRGRIGPGERTVLVVDDDIAFASVLRDLAREKRFRCLVATTAREGLDLAVRHVPSAVLLDVRLPDGSGLAVLERLKHNPATRHIPVHVLSIEDHTQRALEMGAVGYAVKPVPREHLVSALEKLERRIDKELLRLLVVEDATAQREGLVKLLAGERVEVRPVGTAAEALRELGATTFDCMVLDLHLPDMSGFELLDKMAEGEAFSFPPVIVHTARSLTRDEEMRLRKYARSIVIKGARSPERLVDEVTLFLHRVESTLPEEQQRILREVRNRESALEGKQILVADDDVRNVFALAAVLEPRGAKLRIARNGKEALSILDRAADDGDGAVDLVLMDIMMPEMDGLTATREIRKRRAYKDLPIIALTAKAMPSDRTKCLDAGADDYIAKPIDVDKLLSLVKVWITK